MSSSGLERKAAEIIRSAQENGQTIVTAESCTGGALACLLSDAPGAADAFHGGFVVYTKQNKAAALGVPPALIEQHTAVSPEVAEAMARGAIERSPADIAVAITGVAGPEPDEDGNPVGLVYVAAASRKGQTSSEELRLPPAPKPEICRAALRAGLEKLGAMLEER